VLLRPSLDHHSNYMQCVEHTVLIRLLIIIAVHAMYGTHGVNLSLDHHSNKVQCVKNKLSLDHDSNPMQCVKHKVFFYKTVS